MTERARLYPEIKQLREVDGLQWQEIATRFGLARSTVSDIYYDPTGEKVAARKALANGSCVDCGEPTKNSGSRDVPDRCWECRRTFEKTLDYRLAHGGGCEQTWSDDAILAALRMVAVKGRLTIATWDAAYLVGGQLLPSKATIVKRFGSWANAHEAAGLHSRHHRGWSKFTADRCLEAVRTCAQEIGRVPSCSDYRAWAAGGRGPSESLVRARCGRWLEIIREVASPSDATCKTPGNQNAPATAPTAPEHGNQERGS